MLFSTVIAALAAVVAGAPQNTKVGDFRIFGATGCLDDNLGIWTVIDTDFKNNECQNFKGETVRSVKLVDIKKPCKMHVYTDESCEHGKEELVEHQCASWPHSYKAWSMECY